MEKYLLFIQEADVLQEDAEAIQNGFESSWDLLIDKFITWKNHMIEYLPEIVLAFIVFILCYILAIFIKKIVNRQLHRAIKKASIRSLISNLVSIIIIIIGLMICINILNLNDVFTSFLAAGGIAGLAIGLALQGTLANTFSGVFLSLNDMMNVGDWIETKDFEGFVEEINLRDTRIKESDNNIVVIPNKTIIENTFKNFGLTHRIRTTIKCGIHYDSNLREVKDLAVSIIGNNFEQLNTEKVEFHYLEFAQSSINFQIRFWISAKSKVQIFEANSEAMILLKEAFDKNNINIPYPIRTLEFGNNLPKIFKDNGNEI